MSKYATSQEVGTAICKALGIEPNKVRGISLNCSVDEPPTIRVEMYLNKEQADNVVLVLREYAFTPVDDKEKADV